LAAIATEVLVEPHQPYLEQQLPNELPLQVRPNCLPQRAVLLMLPGAAYVTCTAAKAARNHVDKAGIIK
jgi:hypothetical protein